MDEQYDKKKLGSSPLQTPESKIKTILKLTDKHNSRPDIAKAVGVSTITVYKYQKLFGRA